MSDAKSRVRRLGRLERDRAGDELLIIRERPGGSARIADLRTGRVWEATPDEAAGLGQGTVKSSGLMALLTGDEHPLNFRNSATWRLHGLGASVFFVSLPLVTY